MKIAVYTIALNEEQFVESWYNSAKEADYLLIADTGSTDKTVELAFSLGINVVSISVKPWRFDDARNASLAVLPDDIDYCIALDMDEQLQPGWREHLEKATTTRPRYTYTWNWREDGKPGLQYQGDKIHKRHGYRWKHPVHEVLVNDRTDETSETVGLEIHHHADDTKPRSQYMPLLAQSAHENPYDDRVAFYYARELFFYNLREQAKAEFLRHQSLPTATWAPEVAASMRYVAQLSEGQERLEWLFKANDKSPGRRETLVEIAQYYYENQDWENLFKYAQQALDIKEKPLDYLCEEIAWNEKPYDLAALGAYNLGKYELAVEYGSKAAEINPVDERISSNLVFYKAAQNPIS